MKALISLTLISLVLAGCSIKERDPKTPVPTKKKVSTDFFFKYSKDRKTYTPRRFLWGMSSEDVRGEQPNPATRHFRDHDLVTGHSNIEFEFNEDGTELIARLVNPSYPNKRSKWPIVLSFRISGNYYEEKAIDSVGRKTKDKVRRADRSDRPSPHR